MKEQVFLLYLDRYHMGDPLFVKELARELARAPEGARPCLILHGSGEKAERTLEGQGFFIERTDGVLQVEEPAHLQLVERAMREANQEIVATLTDEVVSAVGLQGGHRALLRLGANGEVLAGGLGWVQDLIKMRVLPVVSALVHDGGRNVMREVPAAEAAVALIEGLEAFHVRVVFFTKAGRGGLPGYEGEKVVLEEEGALPGADALPEPDAVRRLATAGKEVLISDLAGFFDAEGPRGTRVIA